MNEKKNNRQTNRAVSKKLRIKFLVLMAISACCAGIALHFAEPGTQSYVPLGCISAISVLTFLISGFGLFTNLYRWMQEPNEERGNL